MPNATNTLGKIKHLNNTLENIIANQLHFNDTEPQSFPNLTNKLIKLKEMLKHVETKIQKIQDPQVRRIWYDKNQKRITQQEILDYISKYNETIQKISDHLQKHFPITSTTTTPPKKRDQIFAK